MSEESKKGLGKRKREGGREGGRGPTWVRVCMSPVSRTLLLLMSRCTMEGLSPWM